MKGMRAYIMPTGKVWSDLNGNVANAVKGTVADKNPQLIWGWGPMYAVLIEHPTEGWIMFDTGSPMDAADRWGEAIMAGVELTFEEGETIEEELATLDLKPEDIGNVILSHMHMDHTGNAFLFAKTADFWVSRKEAEHAFTVVHGDPDPRTYGFYSKADVTQEFKKLHYLDEDEEIFPGIKVIMLPGHTPGSMGIILELESGPIIITADAIYRQENYDGNPPGTIADSAAWWKSMAKVKRLEKSLGAKLWFGHDPHLFPTLKTIPEYYE